MRLLFSEYTGPLTQRDLAIKQCEPTPVEPHCGKFAETKDRRSRWDTLIEQILNSAIVGGISLFSSLAADQSIGLRAGGIAFGLTFLFELRKYRKL